MPEIIVKHINKKERQLFWLACKNIKIFFEKLNHLLSKVRKPSITCMLHTCVNHDAI